MRRDEIRLEFAETAIAHGVAIANADHRKANRLHQVLTARYKESKENQWLHDFVEYIDSPNPHVSLWAATYSLTCDREKAENKLKELSQSSSLVALDAEMTLQMWKKGMLNLL